MPRIALLTIVAATCVGCGDADRSGRQTEAASPQSPCPHRIGVPGDEDSGSAYSPSWSPDGSEIAFTTTSGLHVVTVGTCVIRRVQPTREELAVDWVDWSPDGSSFAFVDARSGGLWVMRADGSRPRRIAEGSILFPAWSPDGRRIAFVDERIDEATASEDRNVWIVNANGSGLRRVTRGRWHGSVDWSPDGRWLVTDADGLVRVRADASGRSVIANGEYPSPCWSPDGSTIVTQGLQFVPAAGGPATRVEVVDGGAFEPCWSPDGKWIAFTDGAGATDLWVAHPDGSGPRQLTTAER